MSRSFLVVVRVTVPDNDERTAETAGDVVIEQLRSTAHRATDASGGIAELEEFAIVGAEELGDRPRVDDYFPTVGFDANRDAIHVGTRVETWLKTRGIVACVLANGVDKPYVVEIDGKRQFFHRDQIRPIT